MITVGDTARSMLDGSFIYYVRASSWLGETLLADDIPVSDASEDSDRSLGVPERVTLTVPKRSAGIDWTPSADTDPLAAKGQTVKISLGIGIGTDGVEWFQRGEYVILSTEDNGDSLRVTCAGLLYLIAEAGFVSPFQPSGTIASTIRALIEPALTADLDSAPSDRAVPAGINWDQDRLGALAELLDAWPADMLVNEQGYLEVLPDTDPTVAVRSFTNDEDDAARTIVTASGSSSRDGGFNVVIATGTASDGGEVRGVAYVTSGPWTYATGTANQLPVPFGYSSPLLTTAAQCTAAAQTVLRRKMRQAVLRSFTITCPPDPTLQLGDAVAVTTDDVTALLCTVEGISLPYVPGPMTLRVVSTT